MVSDQPLYFLVHFCGCRCDEWQRRLEVRHQQGWKGVIAAGTAVSSYSWAGPPSFCPHLPSFLLFTASAPFKNKTKPRRCQLCWTELEYLDFIALLHTHKGARSGCKWERPDSIYFLTPCLPRAWIRGSWCEKVIYCLHPGTRHCLQFVEACESSHWELDPRKPN